MRGLLTASLTVATVKSENQGNVWMVKRGYNNTVQDEAAGMLVRQGVRSRSALRFD